MRAAVATLLPLLARGFQLSPNNSPRFFSSSSSQISMTMIDKPYGTWTSPITSKAITAGSVRLGGVHYCNGNVYWLEGRPQEAGRNVLCKYSPESADKSQRNGVDVSPKESNVRTRVHEYGGGAVVFGKNEDEIYYSEFATQRLCHLLKDGTSQPITEEGGTYRFADGVVSEDGQVIYAVREDHTKPEPKHVVNEIVSINVKDGSMQVLATGNDFYSNPRVDGNQLAYITWNHPNMPWDATELRVTSLSDSTSNKSTDHELIAGSDGDTSIIQPLFHPETGGLFYISDETGHYNIYRRRSDESVLPMEYDFGGSAPGWALGQQGYTFLNDGRLAAQYNKDGKSVLVVANVSDSNKAATDVIEYGSNDGLPMMFGGVHPGEGDDLYFIGGSPSTASSIYKWNLQSKGEASILACSSELSFDDDLISVPKQVQFPTTLGHAFGYYYAPKNGKYTCTTDAAPPLLVKAHGGPTACTGTSFNPSIQYWTSRGFAILDVDYGGSTGYGRDYRRRLRKSWGVVDIDDVCAGAEYLVKGGLADGERLCIDGGSAGGYTTLGALAFRDVFKAGTSLYGIGDLTALAGDTHKFESRYLDGLVGQYPEEEELYKQRSPIESVDTLSCPILLLQGAEDEVVPPNQAEMMYNALLKKGIPTCLKIYEGEQHGFRKAENIEDALDSELAFYGKVFGMDIPDAVDLKVDNI
jgi:dipeptidyl aminopeptidase/acylaminoacyl peptidase